MNSAEGNEGGWTPVLKGRVYCSPYCGMGCKKTDHDKARNDASALCDTLGDGWEPRVWENAGWYCEAVKGNCRVSPPRGFSDNYMLIWDYPVLSTDNKVPQIILHGPDPVALLGLARQDARTWVARIEAELQEVAA